ncbi:MAG: response regulator transcription factor [Acidobacteriota bacterium]
MMTAIPSQATPPTAARVHVHGDLTKILVLTSFHLLQQGIVEALGRLDEYEVEGVKCPHEALDRLGDWLPNYLIIDAKDSIFQYIERVVERCPHVAIILIGVDSLNTDLLRYVRVGVSGYLAQSSTLEELLDAIEQIEQGGVVCSPRLTYSVFGRLAELSSEVRRNQRIEALELTPRELEVMRWIGEGLSNQAIADQLNLSIYTVKGHVHNILDKLDVTSRYAAVDYAVERGWIQPRARRA